MSLHGIFIISHSKSKILVKIGVNIVLVHYCVKCYDYIKAYNYFSCMHIHQHIRIGQPEGLFTNKMS